MTTPTHKKKLLVHLPTPLVPVDTGAKRKFQGLLKYFRDRSNVLSVDAFGAHLFGKHEWTSEQQEEALKSVERFFLYNGERNYIDFLYMRTESFYYKKVKRQMLPVDGRYDTPPGYVQFVRSLAARYNYDAVLIHYTPNAPLVLVPELAAATRLLDVVDLCCEMCIAQKDLPHQRNLKFDYEDTLSKEIKLLNQFDKVIITSQREIEIVKSDVSPEKIKLVPYPLQDWADQVTVPDFLDRSFQYDLLFVGASYFPNVEGMQFFISSVLPHLLVEKPDLKLAVVGTVCNVLQLDAGLNRNVDALGFVPDLLEVYLKSRVIICPLLSGSGTKIKLLEAMAYGLPIVTTTTGASGLSLKDGVNAFITDEPELYARRILELLDNFELAQKFSKQAVTTHDQEYSSKTFYRKFDDILDISPL